MVFSDCDGWQTDENGEAFFKMLPGSSVTIPYSLFAEDRRNLGFTFETDIEFFGYGNERSSVVESATSRRGISVTFLNAKSGWKQQKIT